MLYMRAVIQRVSSAKVEIEGRVISEIKHGLLVFICSMKEDMGEDLDYLVKKISQLRIFADDNGKMNLSVIDVNGSALVVSQFTLAASTRKGNRPSFDLAESPDRARLMVEAFIRKLSGTGITVQTGEFAASMSISLINEGPVTIFIDSREGLSLRDSEL